MTQWHFRKDGDTDIFPISRKVGSGKERDEEKQRDRLYFTSVHQSCDRVSSRGRGGRL